MFLKNSKIFFSNFLVIWKTLLSKRSLFEGTLSKNQFYFGEKTYVNHILKTKYLIQNPVLQIRIFLFPGYFFCQCVARNMVSRGFGRFFQCYSVQSINVGHAFLLLFCILQSSKSNLVL